MLVSLEPSPPVTGTARWAGSALGAVGAAVCALSVIFVVSSVPSDEAVARGLVQALVVGMPIAAGLYALRIPRTARFGGMLLLAGFAWSLTALAESPESIPYSI